MYNIVIPPRGHPGHDTALKINVIAYFICAVGCIAVVIAFLAGWI